ncbi:MAG TPA: 50S ribosomal protein L25 [Candidatus Magasanikbacteria bacterium]|uniref:Large ribosomal subunit protein bL25 n=2 Tax=Candidatus Magasanikiibacteriota TaxID=1752731 RepID=A0A0G0WJB4_9BACT|nr:MAG: 50S ribosomal protein L25 [Candidatus Magasanikbacteria bacterium GW2011_GWC2_41_17]KKS12965.1 MAG: 50S ribosomal protein L25 [Candidatus Magasanikbacteria bacterium GW2011_GWA2_41_55]HBV58252.1 50S ribosomal protein L25 [Candidatus Magasanikbacteria bacterium]HBX16046.1 50S ribosomal protein L25 [Candidatus Magasanikbacteria bacterium]
MSNLSLKGELRVKAAKELRKESKIPAVLYGHGVKNVNLSVNYREFEKAYQAGGGKGLLELTIDSNKPINVLVQDWQINPITSVFTHVDFRQVKMDEKIKTDVNLKFIGESPAVKELGGIFVKNFNSIPVECLPKDLVSEITVDIVSLKEFGNVIHISDIVAPAGIKILAHDEDVIATVTPPRVEEEAAPIAAAVDLSQIKTESEEKKEKKATEDAGKAKVEETAKKEKK